MHLLPFQRRFLKQALRPGIRTAGLSIPRGNGKTTLAAHIALRCLTPGDELFHEGLESHIVAASLSQGRRTVFRQLLQMLPDEGYRVANSQNRSYVEHTDTGTVLSVLPANSKTGQGLVGCPLVIGDEPGAWLVNDGEALFDAIQTAQGKPGSALKFLLVGTVAPARTGWWPDMVTEGSYGPVYVQALQGDRKRWRDLREVRRCNPLMYKFPESRSVLRQELKDAISDSRLKARFLSFRLNLPTPDETDVLLSVEDWERLLARAVPPRQQKPITGIDLGSGRAWSAAAGIWPNGRVEAVAVAPGIPSLEDQERRDKQPNGAYRRLVERGILHVAHGYRVQPVEQLMELVREWDPAVMLADRNRQNELLDAKPPCPVQFRVGRWFEAGEDIRGFRKLALDGRLSVDRPSRPLLQHSLGVTTVESDDQGNMRLIKAKNNTARDDVSSALVLAAGAAVRAGKQRQRKHGVAR